MKNITIVILLQFTLLTSQGQDYALFRSRIQSFFEYGALPDSAERARKINDVWGSLQTDKQIPFAVEDSVAFLYRGQAHNVKWTGDFNAWGYHKDFDNQGRLIPGTDIWILRTSVPKDARLDYKIVLNSRS